MKTLQKIALVTWIALVIITLNSCTKDSHKPATINLKTGAGYTSADANVTRNTTIKVGIIADKVQADMITYTVSYQYDGATTVTTAQTFNLTGTEQQHYDKDVTFTIRNVLGYERWTFTVTDSDGNVAQKLIVFNVF